MREAHSNRAAELPPKAVQSQLHGGEAALVRR